MTKNERAKLVRIAERKYRIARIHEAKGLLSDAANYDREERAIIGALCEVFGYHTPRSVEITRMQDAYRAEINRQHGSTS